MHKMWNNLELINSALDMGVNIKVGDYRLYIWVGFTRKCYPQEIKPLSEFDQYEEYEVFTHKVVEKDGDDKYAGYARDTIVQGIFTRCLVEQELKEIGLIDKYSEYFQDLDHYMYNNNKVFKLVNLPKILLENIYDTLSNIKENKAIKYGGNCKRCGLFDEYAAPNSNGEYFCYQHFYKG